jgi:hypothetical protein
MLTCINYTLGLIGDAAEPGIDYYPLKIPVQIPMLKWAKA